MSLEAAILENTATLKALIEALQATATASASSAPKPLAAHPAAAASGPTTAKVEAAAAPASTTSAPAPAAVSAAAAAPASTAAHEPPTYEQVQKAITDGVKADRAKVVAVLAQFGAKKGPELKPEQYADFVAALS